MSINNTTDMSETELFDEQIRNDTINQRVRILKIHPDHNKELVKSCQHNTSTTATYNISRVDFEKTACKLSKSINCCD